MLHQNILLLLFCGFNILSSCQSKEEETFTPPVLLGDSTESIPQVIHLLTSANESSLFAQQSGTIKEFDSALGQTIEVNTASEYQSIAGFGFALTGGSASHFNGMSSGTQQILLEELFGTGNGQIGMSMIRISVGASDLDQSVFSYNDGSVDVDHNNFSLAPDEEILIPLIKKILAINPDVSVMSSPWSPPAWMKDNNSPKGGSLLREYYDSYALYLLKYTQEMKAHGINIDYLTIQNEPLHPGNNPSMYMSAEDQRDFIKQSLGPLFEENNSDTKLIIYDHNPDKPNYPITVLNDPEAKKYIDGSAFHLYAGDIGALSTVRNAHPEKNIYFTEQWFGAPGNFSEDLKWHTREVVIGSQRNWSRSVIEWNLSSNPELDPHTDGGCYQCLGGITIKDDIVKRNAGYYVIAHVSKYVRPGSIRIGTNYINNLPSVAYLTPSDQIVLLVLNNTDSEQKFNVVQTDTQYSTALDPGAVSTYIWDLK